MSSQFLAKDIQTSRSNSSIVRLLCYIFPFFFPLFKDLKSESSVLHFIYLFNIHLNMIELKVNSQEVFWPKYNVEESLGLDEMLLMESNIISLILRKETNSKWGGDWISSIGILLRYAI